MIYNFCLMCVESLDVVNVIIDGVDCVMFLGLCFNCYVIDVM